MRWFIPSANGDFRLDPDGDSCILKLHGPTPYERKLIGEFLRKAHKKGWVEKELAPEGNYEGSKSSIAIDGPLSKAGALLVSLSKPKDRTLTAVSFKDGKLEVVEGAHAKALEKVEKVTEKKDAKAAATVTRPTPSCPNCYTRDAVEPATEVLQEFMTEEQHEDWSKHRSLVAVGQLTGHRYLIAHRHSKAAEKIGRICYDLDDRCVVHFHAWDVPPEEEVLAGKLILENAEPWLRNEATMYDSGGKFKFKNPFGDGMDGTETAALASKIGNIVMNLMSEDERKKLMPQALGTCGPCEMMKAKYSGTTLNHVDEVTGVVTPLN